MKHFTIIAFITLVTSIHSKAQQALKLDYFNKVPAAITDCGAVYTYDSVSPAEKKYILLTDFQNRGLITVAGKQVSLQLTETKTIDTTNISTYTGGGYIVVLSAITTEQSGNTDMEVGTVQVTKGNQQLILKIHGQSGCDASKQEGN